jgi:DtxR family transcriptional regulator, Mn-dependent transcriptional regulator
MTPNEYSHTEQNYIKAIYHLSRNEDGTAYTQELASAMSTTAASASDMVKKLSEKGLVSHIPYRGAKLNKRGEKTALHIIRRHRLWELFLTKVLKFKWDEVHPIAEELEHVSSDILFARIDEYLNYPGFDPHGDPIPDAHGKIAETNFTLLGLLSKNQSGIISGVRDHGAEFLRYLDEAGMILGAQLKIVTKYEFDKSMDVLINGKKSLHISNQVAMNLLIGK